MLLPFISSFFAISTAAIEKLRSNTPTRRLRNIVLIKPSFENAATEEPLVFYFVKTGTIPVWFDSDNLLTLVRRTALWFTRHDTLEVKLIVFNTSMNRMNARTAMAFFFKHPRVAAVQLLASGMMKILWGADFFLLILYTWSSTTTTTK